MKLEDIFLTKQYQVLPECKMF